MSDDNDIARPAAIPSKARLIDPYGRSVTYVRVSVTDRCDFRCSYCLSEAPTFLPRGDLLSLEELDRLCSAFMAQGVRKLRLTGGEPLVRRNVMQLFRSLSRHLVSGALGELAVTTNGSQLARHAAELAACGVRRVNVSLDTLDPGKFRKITRTGDLGNVLDGIDAAQAAGLSVKVNAVALRDFNADEFASLVEWGHGRGIDVTFIEVMPLGEIERRRSDQYIPLDEVRAQLAARWALADIDYSSGGPARYAQVRETGGRVGFITPMSHNFCESCNRVRVTCAGALYTCLGRDAAADLRAPLRASADDGLLHAAIDEAISRKPMGHDFIIDRRSSPPATARHMSDTGG